MKWLKQSLYALALFASLPLARGQEVGSKAYGLMLSALLSRDVPEVGVDDARAMEEALFVDAREREEYDVSRIPGAVWVGYDTFDQGRLEGVGKERPIVVYCSVGYRSEKITQRLRENGFSQVYNLYGGIFEWVNREMPVEDSLGRTRKVHAYDRFWGQWLKRGQKVYE